MQRLAAPLLSSNRMIVTQTEQRVGWRLTNARIGLMKAVVVSFASTVWLELVVPLMGEVVK